MIEPERVLVVGDLHGNTAYAKKVVDHAAGAADAIVQVGDFGVGWRGSDRFLDALEARLAAAGVHLYWLDGNHDHLTDDYTDRPHITYLPRGTRWTWWGQTWMALGGATSIDRLSRMPGTEWWPEEALTDGDVEYASRPGHVDVLVCHDAPYGANVPGVGLGPPRPCEWPLETQLESCEHRLKLRKVVDAVRPKLVIHGHMHRRYSDMLHLDGRDVLIEGLDCDDAPLVDSTLFINKP